MAGRRVYGCSDMAVLLQNEGIPPEAIDALLASGSSTGGFHGSRSMVSFEDIHGNTPKGPFYRPLEFEESGNEDLDVYFQQPEKKRRLTVDQVQFLEKTFELENKLEPEKKIQLAKDLGLQPRQVAIWFQNRRARWKTKQLEKDYDALKFSYYALKADHENLFKEKEKLKAEVITLTGKLRLREKKGNFESFETNNMSHKLPNPETDSVPEVKRFDAAVVVFKQEDPSSSNSAVSDSTNSCANGVQILLHELADSSKAFEADHSDLSHVEEEEVKGCSFLKLEDNSCNYGFPVEDQAFWFWPY